jgi:hypothetical protein
VTVVLTGDVHQWIRSGDRAYAKETEGALAVEYARIAGRHGLKVTLFFTGRAVAEDAASVRALLDEDNVEIGGHGWDSFRPKWRYRAAGMLFRTPHGSRTMQARMVGRTCRAIERATKRSVRSWRNHAYVFDANTADVLVEAGIRVWSDDVDSGRVGPYPHPLGLTILPVNTTPDHEHVYHGDQTPETIPAARRVGYESPEAWVDRVSRQTETICAAGGTATILAHPLCMKVMDDWRSFEQLCSRVSSRRNAWAHEAAGSEPEDGN